MEVCRESKNGIVFGEKITGVYLFLLFTVFPLAVHWGYSDILMVKTGIFYLLTGSYSLFIIFFLIKNFKNYADSFLHVHFSFMDSLIVCFGLELMVSWLFCLDKKGQFFGIYGRNLGFLAYFFCVLLFYFVTRFLCFSQYILTGLLAAGAVVGMIAVCNFLGFDPLSMYQQFETNPDFMSTMGNINTLSAYLGLLVPFGMVLFCVSSEIMSKAVYGGFCLWGFLGMTAANSDSAFLTVGAAFVLLLLLGKKKENGICFVLLGLEFSLANFGMAVLRQMRGEVHCIAVRQGIPKLFLDIRVNLPLAVFFGILLLGFYICNMWKKDSEKYWFFWRKCMIALLLAVFLLLLAVIFYVNWNFGRKEAREYLGSFYRYFYFSGSWGTKRLRIWRAALTVFGRMPILRKLIGMGPAGFYSAAQTYLTAGELHIFDGQGILIDTHNVYLQILVSFGIIGFFLYFGIFVFACVQFFRKAGTKSYMLAFAVLEIAYLIQALANNAHIYIDPLVFALTAVGIHLCKRKEKCYGSI